MRATLQDGHVAHPFSVDVVADGAVLVLKFENGSEQRVDPALLERLEGSSGMLRLGRTDWPGWRLSFAIPVDADVAALLPAETKGYGRWIDRIGLGRALAVFGIVAVVVVAAGYAAPAVLAPHIPERWERDLGSSLIGDFGDNRCADDLGNAALAEMAERVAPGATGGAAPIQLTAVNYAVFNAAALPGGRIVVFQELINETEAGDQMAGILAHEIAHIRRRHVTQSLVRELGIGALIRLFAGSVGADAQQLVALSYTRKNEEEADRDAIAMLKSAKIDPRPTAQLFAKLARMDGASGHQGFSAEFLRSHPMSARRAKAFADSYDPAVEYRASLSPAKALALRNICPRAGNASKENP